MQGHTRFSSDKNNCFFIQTSLVWPSAVFVVRFEGVFGVCLPFPHTRRRHLKSDWSLFHCFDPSPALSPPPPPPPHTHTHFSSPPLSSPLKRKIALAWGKAHSFIPLVTADRFQWGWGCHCCFVDLHDIALIYVGWGCQRNSFVRRFCQSSPVTGELFYCSVVVVQREGGMDQERSTRGRSKC